jgi:hypothetical protein
MFVKGEIVGISDNVLQEYVAGAHKMKRFTCKKPYTFITIHVAVTDTRDARVWIHHQHFLFGSLLVGNCHCASERSIIVEAYEEFWTDSRSNDG